mmetsp:Transcript_7016/g.11137  ORF Transcript_7016/g.11137 Transcript_7016/m.11137 type:complete len:276 (-) Transcript_7016:806-1633(-)
MTVILFSVSVPVLSEQIVVALPIVSQLSICLTWLLSLVILRIEMAKDSVTASGSPSGTATTSMVIAVIKNPKTVTRSPATHLRAQTLSSQEQKSSTLQALAELRSAQAPPATICVKYHLDSITAKTITATIIPPFPMSTARTSSFSIRSPPSSPPPNEQKVPHQPLLCSSKFAALSMSLASPSKYGSSSSSSSWSRMRARIFPCMLFRPMASTSIFPDPCITFVPDTTNGSLGADSFTSWTALATSAVSPVKALSSIFSPVPSIKTPSQGKISPT